MLGCAWLLVRWPGGVRWLGLSLVLPLLLWQPPRPKPGEFPCWPWTLARAAAFCYKPPSTPCWSMPGHAGPAAMRAAKSIVPLLQALGVRLDRVLLTHADSDHTGGALSVLAAQPQADLLGSGIAALADQAQRPWQPCARGQQWAWDGVHFSVLWPAPATVKAAKNNNTNAQAACFGALGPRRNSLAGGRFGTRTRARFIGPARGPEQRFAGPRSGRGPPREPNIHLRPVAGRCVAPGSPDSKRLAQPLWPPRSRGGAAPDGSPSPDFQHRPVWCDRLAIPAPTKPSASANTSRAIGKHCHIPPPPHWRQTQQARSKHPRARHQIKQK